MRAKRTDKNQNVIIAGFQLHGAEVQSLAAVGDGCPDLLVAYGGRWIVVEVKGRLGKKRPSQLAWDVRFENGGENALARDAGDVPKILGVER